MKRGTLIIAVLAVLCIGGKARSECEGFVRTIGGDQSDSVNCLIVSSDGGIVMTGCTYSYGGGGTDLILVKTDSDGNQTWTRTVGGNGSEVGYCVIETYDGGYVAVGCTDSYGQGQKDVLLVKFDALGNHLWTKTWGGISRDVGYSVIETSNHHLWVTGDGTSFNLLGFSEAYLVEFSSTGTFLGRCHVGWPGNLRDHYGRSLVETSFGFLMVGMVAGASFGQDILLLPFGPGGVPFVEVENAWRIGASNLWETASCIAQCSDGSFVLSGWADDQYSGRSAFVVKLQCEETDADFLWGKSLGGGFPYNAAGYGVTETYDGGVVAVGEYFSSVSFSREVIMAKWSAGGDHLWVRSFGGVANERAGSVIEGPGRNLIVAGHCGSFGASSQDLLLAKCDSTGKTCLEDLGGPDTRQWIPEFEKIHTIAEGWPVESQDWEATVTSPTPNVLDVCPLLGDVDGLLDVTRSPYYVCGDVTVPSGHELVIEPGVQILFVGHYDFNVHGILRAKGTENDSIVFTHYYAEPDSTWGGICFQDATAGCTLQYCVIEYGYSHGSRSEPNGGGIFCDNSSLVMAHCALAHNSAEGSGGGLYCTGSDVKLDTSLIAYNSGGGIYFLGPSDLTLTNCTVSENQPYGIECPYSEIPDWHMTVCNTIVYSNSPGSVNCPCNSFSATYSDIEYDPCGGEGVMDCYPRLDEHFRLTWENYPIEDTTKSCCIDSGDASFPNDPDGTRADIGVFYFHQTCRSWLVKPDGTGDQPTIQDAIDAAKSCDTILLDDGRFWGPGNRDITFRGKGVVVKSINGADACMIDCIGSRGTPHRGFKFVSNEGRGSVLDGVSIVNGYLDLSGSKGGAVFCDGTSPTIIDCRITGNEAFGYGGGIYCDDAEPTIIGCTISGNNSMYGGGLFCDQDSDLDVENTILWGNCAGNAGDEIYLGSVTCSCTLTCCDVNASGMGGSGDFVQRQSIVADPLFFDPEPCDSAPTTEGLFCIWWDSPCTPDSQPECGLIGALGVISGDVNCDHVINVGDVVYLVSYLYKGGPPPCIAEQGDVNCDGITNVGDVVYLVAYLYKGGPPPCCYYPE